MHNAPKQFVLIILDGWGHREQTTHNPICNVATPTFDWLNNNCPHTLLEAAGKAVGLPEGQMGNSEVGHLHIGSGRKVPQDLTRIAQDIQSGDFKKNPVLLAAIRKAKQANSAIHILGLLSPGGVHSHEDQIAALVQMIAEHDVKKNYLHALLDGRDTPPKSALASLRRFDGLYQNSPGGKIASLIGRYYGMDRDQRWQRTEQAYALLTSGESEYHAVSATLGLEMAYARGETDEFVKPTAIHTENDQPITIQNNDVVIFMNFRADRARQLTHALLDKEFSHFPRPQHPQLADFVTLTSYAKDIPASVAYPPLQLHNCLGEYLASLGLRQLHIAETEKYAHVTYFFNGGIEQAFTNEDRILIPSPKVATYDLKPEMSAIELTDRLVAAILSQKYNFIVCNYANPDMVGHTGMESAANKAVASIDLCIKRVIDSLKTVGAEMLLTADHGNIEIMYDEKNKQPHTAHTTNLVPLIYYGRPAKFIAKQGALDDIAPTLLYLMGLQPPQEMTGHNLLQVEKQ